MVSSPIQQLDFVLGIVVKNNKGYATLFQIYEESEKIPNINVNILIDKLMKDGYLEKPWGDSNPQINTTYQVTLEGLIFYEKGGYQQEDKIIKTRLRKDSVYIYSVAIGTAFAGLYGLFEIAKWVMHHLKWHLPF